MKWDGALRSKSLKEWLQTPEKETEMPKFIFAYHGGKRPASDAEYKKVMADWGAFFEKMGKHVADAGGPLGQSHTVNPGGVETNGGSNPVSGYTLVEAASLDAAVAMASDCPMVRDGSGSVEVAEILRM
jgi:hypothetical protein